MSTSCRYSHPHTLHRSPSPIKEQAMSLNLLVPRDTSTVLGGGTYRQDDSTFPYTPDQLAFPRYQLLGTYGKSEAEETAARIITLCQQLGSWAAFNWNVLRRMVADELQTNKLQSGQVLSLICVEMTRFGSQPDEWINNVIGVGLHHLKDNGYIDMVHEADGDARVPLVRLRPKFFEPIGKYAQTAA